ncbi:MAG: hypothetical protein PVF65_03365 [Sphingomonadales bacterium]|jgi:hypothetical protein
MKKLLWWIYYSLTLTGFVSSGFFLARQLADSGNYVYVMTDQVLDQVRARVDIALFNLIPSHMDDRTGQLGELVETALDEGDVERAEAYLTHAPVILGEPWRSDFEAALGVKREEISQDQLAIDMALSWIPAKVALHYTTETSPLGETLRTAEEAAEGFAFGNGDSVAALGGSVASDFLLWGDIRDFTTESWHFARGEEVDYVIYALSGIGLGLTATTIATEGATAPVKGAASLLKAAKRANMLRPPYAKQLGDKVIRAVPPETLSANLRQGLQTLTLSQLIKGGAATHFQRAWAKSIDEQAYAVLKADFMRVGRVYDATSTQTTLRLLRHMENSNDLVRLDQVTQAAPKSMKMLERGYGRHLLDFAKGSLKVTAKMLWSALGLVLSFLLSLVLIRPKTLLLR